MKKKVLALVVLAAMLISILPMAAFAGTPTYAFNAAAATIAPNGSANIVINVTPTAPSDAIEVRLAKVSGVTYGTPVGDGTNVPTTVTPTEEGGYIKYTATALTASAGTITIPVSSTRTGTYSISSPTAGLTTAPFVLTVSAPTTGQISYLRSSVKVDTESAAANGSDKVELIVSLFDQYWNAINVASDTDAAALIGTEIFVATSRGTGAEDVTASADSGKLVVELASSVPGSAKVVIGTEGADTAAAYAQNATGATNITSEAIGDGTNYKFDVTFSAPDASSIVHEGSVTYSGSANKGYANGSSYATVKFAVKAASGAPISGKEVTFSVSGVGATLNKNSATTDATGVVEVRVTSTKPGTYYVGAKSGDQEIDATQSGGGVPVVFEPISIDTVKGLSDDNQKIALDTTSSGKVTLKYSFSDANGNKIDIDDTLYHATDAPKGVKPATGAKELKGTLDGATLTVITKPSGAKINTEMKYDTDYTLGLTDDNDLKIVVKGERLDKEGDYEIKFTLMNGKSVTYKFNVKKQGTVTGMTLKYDAESLPAGKTNAATSVSPTVKLVDAEGYAKEVSLPDSKVSFTVDNAALATISNTGALKVVSDDTGVIVVTAIHSGKNLVASATINIVKAASYLKLTPVSIAAGETVKVPVQLVDVDGKAVAIGTGVTSATAEAIVISKPEGAVVSTNVKSSLLSDVKESGKFTVDVLSNVEGKVKVQVVLKTIENAVDKVYTGAVELNVGKTSGINGNNIVFIIGASSYVVDGKPVASTSVPFIENGRTFLGIRDMGLAMGIIGDENIVWDKATQTAKLVKDGITVEVTVGASAIKVTKNNVTTEVAIDAPAQNKDGRVFLPFRAVFEAFGYSVEYANGSITVTK